MEVTAYPVRRGTAVIVSVDCLRCSAEPRLRKTQPCPTTSAAVTWQRTVSSWWGEVEEQLDHRQLAYRMSGRLLDDMPQAVPCTGMVSTAR